MKHDDLTEVTFYSLETNRNVIYAEYVIPANYTLKHDTRRISLIDSVSFKRYLENFILPNNNDLSVKDIIDYVKAYCDFYPNKDKISPKIRAGGKLKDGLIEYALYDDESNYVKVTPSGWEIVKTSKHKFVDTIDNSPQIIPEKSQNPLIELLSKYINADKDSIILFAAWLVQSFCEGNHSALLVMAEKGSGKSTLTKMIKRIIDPSNSLASIFPDKIENLLTALTNSYVVTFDNTDKLSDDASNILCTAVTGGNYVKRELYTTNTSATFTLHNIIILNGIDILPKQSDLANRCLLLELKKISSKKRQADTSIITAFERDLPCILGGIFDALAQAMNIINDLHPTELPRMAESYIEMLAIAMALGVSEGDFDRIYKANIARIDSARSSESDFIIAVKEYMLNNVKGRSIQGTVSNVYNKIYTATAYRNALPKSPSQFSRKLNAEHDALRAAGLNVMLDSTHANGTLLKITKI